MFDSIVPLLDLYEVDFQNVNEIFLVAYCHLFVIVKLQFWTTLDKIQGPKSDLEAFSPHASPEEKSRQAACNSVSPVPEIVLYFGLLEVANHIKPVVSFSVMT